MNNFYCTIAETLTSNLSVTTDPLEYFNNLQANERMKIYLTAIKAIIQLIKKKTLAVLMAYGRFCIENLGKFNKFFI